MVGGEEDVWTEEGEGRLVEGRVVGVWGVNWHSMCVRGDTCTVSPNFGIIWCDVVGRRCVLLCTIPLPTYDERRYQPVNPSNSARIRHASPLPRASARRRGDAYGEGRNPRSVRCWLLWQVHSRAPRGVRGAARDRRAPDGAFACRAPIPARRRARGWRTRAR